VKRAAEICGEQELAIHLGTTRNQLLVWIGGLALPPDYVFLQVVDILSEHALRELTKQPESDPGTRDRDGPF
jgi:hypothetical protein